MIQDTHLTMIFFLWHFNMLEYRASINSHHLTRFSAKSFQLTLLLLQNTGLLVNSSCSTFILRSFLPSWMYKLLCIERKCPSSLLLTKYSNQSSDICCSNHFWDWQEDGFQLLLSIVSTRAPFCHHNSIILLKALDAC